jgi:hypothetical protein
MTYFSLSFHLSALSLELSALSFRLYAMRFALCTMLQDRGNFLWIAPENKMRDI